MTLNIVVCVKIVPKPEEVKLDPETSTLDRGAAENIINPSDKNALEFALALKEKHGGRITLLSMGPPLTEELLRVSMAMGADDVVLLTDRAFAGADTYPTSLTLAEGIRKLSNVDLVLCGEESADGGTAQVPPGLAEWLGFALTTYANELSYDEGKDRFIARRSISGGNEVLSIPRPAVISVELGVNSPRFPNFNRMKELTRSFKVTMWSAQEIDLETNVLGLEGSHTTVEDLVEVASADRKRQYIQGSPQEIASKLADIILDHAE